MSSAVPSNLSSFIQSMIPGFGGLAPGMNGAGVPPSFSDGDGFDMWMSGAPSGMPVEFMNFSQMDPYSGYGSQPAPAGGYPGFVGFSPQANFPFPIQQGPYQTQPVPQQDGFNWFASSPPVNTTSYQSGGYPGFVGFSPQVNFPFPIEQGPYQTQPMPHQHGGGQLMSHYYSDGNTTYWGETKPDGYYQFTPNGNNVTVVRTEGYDDPNPHNYAYHPYFSGWAMNTPYSSNTSQNPYYQG